MMSKKVTILGSGLIGSQWSFLYASAGYQATMYDSVPGRAAESVERIRAQMAQMSLANQLRGDLELESQQQLVTSSDSLESALAGACAVHECVFEDVEVKRSVFQQLDKLAPSSAVLCSSSSCIAVSKFVDNLDCRSRCLVAHPVNPPHLVPLVELVPATFTDPQAVETAKMLMQQLGQQPVVLNAELDGFALNRMQYAIINEAWRLVTSGAMSAEDVDKVMTHGLAPRYCCLGPLGVMQTNADGIADYCSRYAAGITRVSDTFGPTPAFSDEEIRVVSQQVEAYLPRDKLEMAKGRRDRMLAQLQHLRDKGEEKQLE